MSADMFPLTRLASCPRATHHDLPSSINVGVEQTKNVLERDVGLRGGENGRPDNQTGRYKIISDRGREAFHGRLLFLGQGKEVRGG